MDMLIPDIAITEKLVRSVVVYLFLLVAFRVAGKRELGQLTAFDLVVLLVISNVLQNAAIGSDNSLGCGLLGATIMHVLHASLDREHMSMAELRAALRKECLATMSEVRSAILEKDGHVSVIPRRALPA